MKKTIITSVIVASLLLTACSSGQPEETSASSDETTTAETTTEATTTTTEETDESEPGITFTNDEYAGDFIILGVASDFDWGSNAILSTWHYSAEDVDYPAGPSYPAGEDIVISFTSDKDLEIDLIRGKEVAQGYAVPFRELANSLDYGDIVERITDRCTIDRDGNRYTITIPGESVDPEWMIEWGMNDGNGWALKQIKCL